MVVQASKPTASAFRRTTIGVRRHAPMPTGFVCNEEPGLDELMADPMTRRLMASDGITPDALMNVIAQAQERLR